MYYQLLLSGCLVRHTEGLILRSMVRRGKNYRLPAFWRENRGMPTLLSTNARCVCVCVWECSRYIKEIRQAEDALQRVISEKVGTF